MGLDFTNIEDRSGAALYVLTNGMTREIEKFERLKDELRGHTSHQAVILDVHTPDGEKIRDFYDIMPEELPVAFIVRDDDSIAHKWHKDAIPAADIIAHHLRQISN